MTSLFARDDVMLALLRQATARRNSGDLQGAIECLRQAQRGAAKSPVDWDISIDLRLAEFLQEANRYDEALREMRRLFDGVQTRTAGFRPNGRSPTPRRREFFEATEYCDLYRTLRTLMHRQTDVRLRQCEEVLDAWLERNNALNAICINRRRVQLPDRPEVWMSWASTDTVDATLFERLSAYFSRSGKKK